MKRINARTITQLLNVIRLSDKNLPKTLGPGIFEIVLTTKKERLIITGSYYYDDGRKEDVRSQRRIEPGNEVLNSCITRLVEAPTHPSFITCLGKENAPRIIWEFCIKQSI